MIAKRKLSTIFLTLMILMVGSVVALGLREYWARQFTAVTFHWHYDYVEGFSCTDWDDYANQIESLIPVANSIMITLTEEDVQNSPLSISLAYTCDLPGAELTCVGRYMWARYEGEEFMVTSDSEFDIPTDGTPKEIIEEKLTWGDWSNDGDGQALELIFTVQTSGITEPTGDYSYQVSVSLGAEP